MNIYIGSDHGGFELKSKIIEYLKKNNYQVIDKGCFSNERCDYPDFAHKVCDEVINNNQSIGILVCGTGIGISIAANKVKNIRCAVCNDLYSAEMAKKHNNANVIAFGSRIIAPELSFELINKFVETEFELRHQHRIDKIHEIEKKIINQFLLS